MIVECPGYATVRFDSSTYNASVQLGDGSILSASPSFGYMLSHSDTSQLKITKDGEATFQPKPNNDLETLDGTKSIEYSMSHFTKEIVKVTDNENTDFIVTNTGDITVTNQNNDFENDSPIVTYKQHAPRYSI